MFYIFSTDKYSLKAHILINLGINKIRFIDFRFTYLHKFPLIFIKKPRRFQGFNGQNIDYGIITKMAKAIIKIGGHKEIDVFFYVTRLNNYTVILSYF